MHRPLTFGDLADSETSKGELRERSSQLAYSHNPAAVLLLQHNLKIG